MSEPGGGQGAGPMGEPGLRREAGATAQPGEAAPGGSALTDASAGRLLGALVAPGKTFASIARRPTWALAIVLLTLLGVGESWVVMQHTDLGPKIRQQLEKSGKTLTPEETESQVEVYTRIARITGAVLPVIAVPAVYLLIALIFWLGLRLVGGELRYPVALSVALHGMLPFAVSGLLAVPVLLSRGLLSEQQMRRGVLASNLGVLAPEGASPALVALLGSLDLFSIWSLILLVIGYRIAARVSTGAAAGVVVGAWALYVLGKVALTAAFVH